MKFGAYFCWYDRCVRFSYHNEMDLSERKENILSAITCVLFILGLVTYGLTDYLFKQSGAIPK